jgi:hypothetical protein
MLHLQPAQTLTERPFTHPDHLAVDQRTLSYMAGQVCVLLEYPYLSAEPPHIVLFNRPDHSNWFHRIVIAQPEELREVRPLTIVGFFGQKRDDADMELAHEFDRVLIAEIPAHPGLLSYSTMALSDGNYANLVIFAHDEARNGWSSSQAHAQAVRQLSPNYYWTVCIYNGRLPQGIYHHHHLQLSRANYYDYQSEPRWQAVREITSHP